jgi:Excreted virulence factor EspC, type VII ESX diderm
MSEPIRITPSVLREVAGNHDEVARTLDEARQKGADIHAAAQTLGPIMHQVKSAVSDVLAEREEAFVNHAARHRAASNELHSAANIYTSVDEQNASDLDKLTDS